MKTSEDVLIIEKYKLDFLEELRDVPSKHIDALADTYIELLHNGEGTLSISHSFSDLDERHRIVFFELYNRLKVNY